MVMYPQNKYTCMVIRCKLSCVASVNVASSEVFGHSAPKKGHVVCVRLLLQHTFISFFKLALSGVESRHVCKMVRIV